MYAADCYAVRKAGYLITLVLKGVVLKCFVFPYEPLLIEREVDVGRRIGMLRWGEAAYALRIVKRGLDNSSMATHSETAFDVVVSIIRKEP